MLGPGFRTMKSVGFLFKAPFILALLVVISIAWFLALFRVLRTVILAGGLAALGFYLFSRYGKAGAAPGAPSSSGAQPPDIPTVPLRLE